MPMFVMFKSARVKQIYAKALDEGIIPDTDAEVVVIVKQYSKSGKALGIRNVTEVTAAAFVPSAGNVTVLIDDKAYMQDMPRITAKLWTRCMTNPSVVMIKETGRPVRIM